MNLSRRSSAAELMDDPTIDASEFAACLAELEIINRWTLAYRPTLRWLVALLPATSPQETSLLDVGCGGGDMLRRIAALARRLDQPLRLIGIDLNPHAVATARVRTRDEIAFEQGDIYALAADRRFDFIVSSLFTHHLSDSEIVEFLQWMERHATRGWFINDLHRHPVPFHFIGTLLRLLPCGRMVRHDAPVSVARAFTAADWRRLLAAAGVPADAVRIRWYFPFRYGVGRTWQPAKR